MENWSVIYTGLFFASIALIATWEAFAPRKALSQPMGLRWVSNISIALLNIFLLRVIFPIAPVLLAVYASENNLGLFNLFDAPYVIACIVSFAVLDLSAYTQHYLLHRVPLLWRLHLVHHTDIDYDFSIALRFHPLDGIFTTAAVALTVLILGAPAIAVLIYKCIHVFMAAFAHGNLKLPEAIDRHLRTVLVTPDVHRIHHSATENETNSNYGGVTPIWDRLFGTYIDQPKLGHEKMIVGLKDFRDIKSIKLNWMLALPFLSNNTNRTAAPEARSQREN